MAENTSWYLADELRDGPWGGGNSFLRTLSKALSGRGKLAEDPFRADIVLFNSHQNLRAKIKLLREIRKENPSTLLVHRVDGPVSLSRCQPRHQYLDNVIFELSSKFADLTIFQSQFSYLESLRMGFPATQPVKIIGNSVDSEIFYVDSTRRYDRAPSRIVTTAWSDNPNKGLLFLRYLDSKIRGLGYEFEYFGPPQGFQNIKEHGRVPAQTLAAALRSADYFITGSRNDSCSNSLIEAMACGATPLALMHGGHPEIVGDANFLFNSAENLFQLLDRRLLMTDPHLKVREIDQIIEDYEDGAGELMANSQFTFKPKPNLRTSSLSTEVATFYEQIEEKFGGMMPLSLQRKVRPRVFGNVQRETWRSSKSDFLALGDTAIREGLQRFLVNVTAVPQDSSVKLTSSGDLKSRRHLDLALCLAQVSRLAVEDRDIIAGPASPRKTQIRPTSINSAAVEDGIDWAWREAKATAVTGFFLQNDYSLQLHLMAEASAQDVDHVHTPFQPLTGLSLQTAEKFEEVETHRAISLLCSNVRYQRLLALDDTTAWSSLQYLLGGGSASTGDKGDILFAMNSQAIACKIALTFDLMNQLVPAELADKGISSLLSGETNVHIPKLALTIKSLQIFSRSLPGQRRSELVDFSNKVMTEVASRYWPQHGGFSFYPSFSVATLSGKKYSNGFAEPDLIGTFWSSLAYSEARKVATADSTVGLSHIKI